MIIKTSTNDDDKRELKCPHCGKNLTARHRDLGYCSKCYKSLDKTDRSLLLGRV